MIYKDPSTAVTVKDARTAALFFDYIIPVEFEDMASAEDAGVFPTDASHPDVGLFALIFRAIYLGRAAAGIGYQEIADNTPFDFVVFGAPHSPAQLNDTADPCLVLSELNLIDGAALTWAQVVEFRKDRASVERLRGLRRMVFKDYSGKPASYIREDIEARIADHEATTKFWNFPVAKGMLEIALTGEAVTLAGALTLKLLGLPVAAAAAAGCVTAVGKAALAWTARKREVASIVAQNPLSYLVSLRRAAAKRCTRS